MIATVTANPSTDHTVMLDSPLERGAVLRATSSVLQAGGKGVNISRAAVAAGVASVAVVPVPEDDPFALELLASGVRCQAVGPAGSPRSNITITEPDGTTTKVNMPGPVASSTLLDGLAATAVRHARQAAWVVLAGSLPPGTSPQWYADLVPALRSLTAVAVDTSDAPLRALVDRLPQSAPALLKPNAEELAAVTGADPEQLQADPRAAAKAAGVLVESGIEACLATLGGSGAVLVTPDGAWHATPPPTTVVSTVGAGDSSLFGYLLADIRGLAAPDKLRLAVAYGSAAAGLPGTTIPTPAQVPTDSVTIHDLGPTTGER